MYKNYIFDFGKVIVEFEPKIMTEKYIKNSNDKKAVEDIIFDRLYWDKLDEGTITDNKVKEGICSRLPERLHKSAIQVYDNWYYNRYDKATYSLVFGSVNRFPQQVYVTKHNAADGYVRCQNRY